MKLKPYIKIALFTVFFIALGGILAGLWMFNRQHKDLLNVRPDYKITAIDLQKAFEDSEAAATERYMNKVIEVSGVIESVKSGEDNILSVILKTGSDLSSVICTFPSGTDHTLFSSGNQITIRGECSGFLMDVLLNNCVLKK